MNPVVESIEDAMQHFGGDLEELLDGKNGWDLSEGLWQKSGWREFRKLRKKLANLRELRDLVRPYFLFRSIACSIYVNPKNEYQANIVSSGSMTPYNITCPLFRDTVGFACSTLNTVLVPRSTTSFPDRL